MKIKERRFDLDWWRIISIMAVYLHHVCMPFNGDQYHIMNTESSKVLDDIMVFFEQFRLPLLFFISGTGTVYAFSSKAWQSFFKERTYRLLVPLIFGMLVIVPPQTYFENIDFIHSYFDVYTDGFFKFQVNHLWFIKNLYFMSLASIPIILLLRLNKTLTMISFFNKITAKKYGVFLLVIPLAIITVVSKRYYPSDSKDITNLSTTLFYGYFFIMGIMIATSKQVWVFLKDYRKTNFIIAVVFTFIFYTYYFLPDEIASQHLTLQLRWDLWYFVCCTVSWSIIITAIGYGQIWLNKKSHLLGKLNEGIYPFYILHQTVIIVFAYFVVQLHLSIGLKILLLFCTSLSVIIIIYRVLVYPFKWTRILFGMKPKIHKF